MGILPMLVLLLGLPVHAWGYLDAGSGSIFLQFLTAFIFSGLYFLKSVWARMWYSLRRMLSHRSIPKE